MPFRSKKQWKFAFATDQKWARKWAHETKRSYKALPSKVKKSKGKKKRK